eukprot:scaffold154448_cov22-Tisochrysis_lutea.AAC.1
MRAVADLAATSEGGQLGDGSQQQQQQHPMQDEQDKGGRVAAARSRKQGQGSKSVRSKAAPSEKSVKVKEEQEDGDTGRALRLDPYVAKKAALALSSMCRNSLPKEKPTKIKHLKVKLYSQ